MKPFILHGYFSAMIRRLDIYFVKNFACIRMNATLPVNQNSMDILVRNKSVGSVVLMRTNQDIQCIPLFHDLSLNNG